MSESLWFLNWIRTTGACQRRLTPILIQIENKLDRLHHFELSL